MSTVSAVVVTLNEEEVIESCLQTLSWCDEIILVDNDSEDQTVDIARNYVDEVYVYEERHGYGDPLKEYGVQKANSDWIFIIDADELVPKSLAVRLLQIVEKDEYDVVRIPFKHYSIGKWIDGAGWWPSHHPRLFKRDEITVSDEIHGYLHVHDRADVLKLPSSEKNAVIHFNHIDIEDKLNRINMYTSVEARQGSFSLLRLLYAPLFEFFRRLVYLRGYRVGIHGLLLSALQAWYKFLAEIKRWERERLGGTEGIKKRYNEQRNDILREWE